MKSICKIFLEMSVIFRDESNDDNQSMICYSDATIPFSNCAVKSLIRFSSVTSTGVLKLIL